MTEAFNIAKSIIEGNKQLVEILFKELKEKEKLSKQDVENILLTFNGTIVASAKDRASV